MHCLEILLKTTYARPYMRALGIDINNAAYIDIKEIFEIPSGILEDTHADTEHDLLTLEILMKELHFPKSGTIKRFTNDLMPPLREIVLQTKDKFARRLKHAVFSTMDTAGQASQNELTCSEMRVFAKEHCERYIQVDRSIKKSILI